MDRRLIDRIDFKAPAPCKGAGKPVTVFEPEQEDRTPLGSVAVRVVCAAVAALVIAWFVGEMILMSFSFMGGHVYKSWFEFWETGQHQDR